MNNIIPKQNYNLVLEKSANFDFGDVDNIDRLVRYVVLTKLRNKSSMHDPSQQCNQIISLLQFI